jgi:hypothetical protein
MHSARPRWLVTAELTGMHKGIRHRAFRLTDRDPETVAVGVAAGLKQTRGGKADPTVTIVPYKPATRRRPVVARGSKHNIIALRIARHAENYVRWLAERDGIEITGEPRLHFDHVTAKGRREQRVRAVQFDKMSILIPHWDFVPADPVEVVE